MMVALGVPHWQALAPSGTSPAGPGTLGYLTGRPRHPRVPSRPDQPRKKPDNQCAKIWGPQHFIWLEMAKETLCTIRFFLGQKMANCSWPRATMKNLYHQIVAQTA